MKKLFSTLITIFIQFLRFFSCSHNNTPTKQAEKMQSEIMVCFESKDKKN